MDSRYIEVATSDSDALVKIAGLGDMNLAPTLDDMTLVLFREGCRHLAIDLSECTGMDSTFMGTLISINVRFSEEDDGWMCLINVNPENKSLLKMLGVWSMLKVRETFPMEPVKTTRIKASGDCMPEKRMQIIQIAHERLIELNGDNKKRFGPFLKCLKDDISSDRS